MTQIQNTTRARILATFESHTFSEVTQIVERFLSEGEGREVSVDGDRRAIIGYYGPHEPVQWDSDGSSDAVMEVDG